MTVVVVMLMMITMSVKMKAGEDHNGDLVIQSYRLMSHKLALLFVFFLVRYKI